MTEVRGQRSDNKNQMTHRTLRVWIVQLGLKILICICLLLPVLCPLDIDTRNLF
jgi:hypothetical protein